MPAEVPYISCRGQGVLVHNECPNNSASNDGIETNVQNIEENVVPQENILSEEGTNTEVIWPSKLHTNGTPGHWETILDEVDAMKNSGDYKIPKVLIDRMKDNQRIMGDRAGNIKIRNIGGD